MSGHNFVGVVLKVGAVEAKLNQISKENKVLTEMVGIMQANYTALCSQFFNLVSPSKEEAISPSRKRKTGQEIISFNQLVSEKLDGFVNQICSNPSKDDSFKRLREDPRPKISKVYVQTDPSDLSLVSSKAKPDHEFYLSYRYSLFNCFIAIAVDKNRW